MRPSKIFVYSLISTIILFIVANLAFCEGDWTVHKDPLGFQVSHPNGWSVETPGKEFIPDQRRRATHINYSACSRPNLT